MGGRKNTSIYYCSGCLNITRKARRRVYLGYNFMHTSCYIDPIKCSAQGVDTCTEHYNGTMDNNHMIVCMRLCLYLIWLLSRGIPASQ